MPDASMAWTMMKSAWPAMMESEKYAVDWVDTAPGETTTRWFPVWLVMSGAVNDWDGTTIWAYVDIVR